MSNDEDPRLHELEGQLRRSLARRQREPDRHAKARIARRIGLPPPRRARWKVTASLLAALLAVILTSLIWLGSLIGGRPSPTGPPATPPASSIEQP